MLELDDIQGLVLRGYHLGFARFFFLRIATPEQGQRWLPTILDDLTTASEWTDKPLWCLNVAFTHDGLRALGVPQASLASFEFEFQQGIVARARDLGDTGDSSPERWDGGLGSGEVHALLMLFAQTPDEIETQSARQRARLAEIGGITELYVQDAGVLPGLREHFGYRDGITRVIVEGTGVPPVAGQPEIKAGEFVLGYPDERGEIANVPQPAVLGRNGSYLVYRKFHQDVAGFRRFLRQTAQELGRDEEWLAAKLMGRWRSGAPLLLSPEADDPSIVADPQRNNNFLYKEQDPRGLICPLGSHLRRVAPRDDLSEAEQRRHQIMRRGLPYGPPLPEDASDDDGVDRGIMGLMINASISRQFEFIQRVWINNRKFNDLPNDKDPIVGDNDGTSDMTIQARPVRKRIKGLPRFTSVRGGGYFFAPGLKALQFLAGSTPAAESAGSC